MGESTIIVRTFRRGLNHEIQRIRPLAGCLWTRSSRSRRIGAVASQTRLVLPECSRNHRPTSTPSSPPHAKAGQLRDGVADPVRAKLHAFRRQPDPRSGTFAHAAKPRRRLEVNFDRLTMPDGRGYTLNGSFDHDAADRRQIESDPNAPVVVRWTRLSGGAIAEPAREQSIVRNPRRAGHILPQARDFESRPSPHSPFSSRTAVPSRAGRESTGFVHDLHRRDRIRAAQEALARQNYYRGPTTPVLTKRRSALCCSSRSTLGS